MSKSIKVVVKRRDTSGEASSPEQEARIAAAVDWVRGLRKKGDNLKVMVDKLNEHGHLDPDGQPWSYDSLNAFVHQHHL